MGNPGSIPYCEFILLLLFEFAFQDVEQRFFSKKKKKNKNKQKKKQTKN